MECAELGWLGVVVVVVALWIQCVVCGAHRTRKVRGLTWVEGGAQSPYAVCSGGKFTPPPGPLRQRYSHRNRQPPLDAPAARRDCDRRAGRPRPSLSTSRSTSKAPIQDVVAAAASIFSTPPALPPGTRPLGTQENLFAPRQYMLHEGEEFPPFVHVCHVSLSSTPPADDLLKAIEHAVATHPMLSRCIRGSGQPSGYWDSATLKMVRRGDPDPLRFEPIPKTDAAAVAKAVFNIKDIPVPRGTTTTYTSAHTDNTITIPVTTDLPSRSTTNITLPVPVGTTKITTTVTTETPPVVQTLEAHAQHLFGEDLDKGQFPLDTGPLWSVTLLRTSPEPDAGGDVAEGFAGAIGADGHRSTPCILCFTLMHCLDDQSSLHLLLNHILDCLQLLSQSLPLPAPIPVSLPPALETSVLKRPYWSPVEAAPYMVGKGLEIVRLPKTLPSKFPAEATIPAKRRSCILWRTLPESVVSSLRDRCREMRPVLKSGKSDRAVGINELIVAAVTVSASRVLNSHSGQSSTLKVLQALDMRRCMAEGLSIGRPEGISCAAGSMDLLLNARGGDGLGGSGSTGSGDGETDAQQEAFNDMKELWRVAREAADQTGRFLSTGGPRDAVGVMDWGMRVAEITNLVELEASNSSNCGRAYSCGVSNAGVFVRTKGHTIVTDNAIETSEERYKVQAIRFATPHARTGSTLQVSCVTVPRSGLNFCFHPVVPVISEEQASGFADSVMKLLQTASGVSLDGDLCS